MSKSTPTPREIGTNAYLDSGGNTLAGMRATFDAYDAALIAIIEDIRDDAPSSPYDNGGTRDGWQMACAAITKRIHALAATCQPYTGPARDGIEAMRGLNDIWPGDPV